MKLALMADGAATLLNLFGTPELERQVTVLSKWTSRLAQRRAWPWEQAFRYVMAWRLAGQLLAFLFCIGCYGAVLFMVATQRSVPEGVLCAGGLAPSALLLTALIYSHRHARRLLKD